jgi:hypothetical protein
VDVLQKQLNYSDLCGSINWNLNFIQKIHFCTSITWILLFSSNNIERSPCTTHIATTYLQSRTQILMETNKKQVFNVKSFSATATQDHFISHFKWDRQKQKLTDYHHPQCQFTTCSWGCPKMCDWYIYEDVSLFRWQHLSVVNVMQQCDNTRGLDGKFGSIGSIRIMTWGICHCKILAALRKDLWKY